MNIKELLKRFFWYFIAGLISVIVYANMSKCNAQTRQGKTFIAKRSSVKQDTIITDYKYIIKEVEYPIILSKTSCYIGRISKNGKYYRYYLNKEINATIREELKIK